mgnify:CR=1 FL=1
MPSTRRYRNTLRKGRPFSGPRGFTLLETLVAMSIAATVLTAVYRLNVQSIAMAESAGFQNTAAFLAQQKVAQLILAEERREFAPEEGRFEDAFDDWHWRAAITPVHDDLFNPPGHRMTRIDVTVSRQNRGPSYRIRRYHLFGEAR